MRLPALLLVAGLVGWGVQAHAGAPEDTAGAAEAPSKPATANSTIAKPGQNKQTTAKPARNRAAPAAHHKHTTAEVLCRTVERAAAENELPVDFFARVIWQESRFDTRAVSSSGAKGIAQFTPQTAVFRGLSDPFDPISSLKNAARYLGDLRKMFGNLGLAAAGYNAGPGRVREWLDGKEELPQETRNYVAITTGWSADEWASPSPPRVAETTIPQDFPCASIAHLVLAPPMQAGRVAACVPPWDAHLTANWLKARGFAAYSAPQEHLATLIGNREPSMRRKRFGNLKLAAACSNVDPAWMHEWRAAKGALIATGWTTDEWASRSPLKTQTAGVSEGVSLASTAPHMEALHTAGRVPRWGAQLTANWSQERAWATYRTMQKQFASLIGDREPIMLHGTFPGLGAAPRYMVRIADDNRAYLEGLCNKLIAAGAGCAVLRNEQDQGAPPPGSQSGTAP
jgi:hypothetical protein